jgi:hypothetical protein
VLERRAKLPVAVLRQPVESVAKLNCNTLSPRAKFPYASFVIEFLPSAKSHLAPLKIKVANSLVLITISLFKFVFRLALWPYNKATNRSII